MKTIVVGMVCWGGKRAGLENLTCAAYERAATLASNVTGHVVAFIGDSAEPLGFRHNRMLEHVREYAPDAFVLVGSDDWMDSECFDRFEQWLENDHALVALNDIYIGQASTGRLVRYASPAIGVGRMVRRDVLDACGWKLWVDALERKLDSSMAGRIGKCSRARWHYEEMRESAAVVVDIKTEQNLWSFDRFADRGIKISVEERDHVFRNLDQDALSALRTQYPEFKP
jgi:hypothetical protein